MANALQKNFVEFLTQDVKNEAETKELAVLIRTLDCIFGMYFMIIAFMLAYLEYYILSLVLVFGIGLLAGSFICTYENRTQLGLNVFAIVLFLLTSFLTLKVGWSKNYHWFIFLTILVYFFNLQKTHQFRIAYSIFIVFYVMGLSFYAISNPVLRVNAAVYTIIITLLNIIVFSSSLTVCAYFFCAKFMKSEEKIMQYNKKLIKMASVDALTGLQNRRSMNEHLKDLVFNYNKTGKSFCIAIGDVDFFKTINDTYGHDTGDYVLVTLSNLFKKFMDDKGTIARWGGEEFLFVFDTGNIDVSYSQLEQLRIKIAELNLVFKEYSFSITMTFGLEEYDEHAGIEAVISHADIKLYNGKESGRNRVVK